MRGIISSNTYNKKGQRKMKLIKLFDNHYAALFSLDQKQTFVECQNIVLSVVEAALSDRQIRFESHNKGKFINFELKEWKKNSGFINAPVIQKSSYDFKNFLYTNPNLNQSGSNRVPSESISDNRSGNRSSVDSVGSEIISILEQRRKENRQTKMLSAVENRYDLFVNSSDHQSQKTPTEVSLRNESGKNSKPNRESSLSKKRANRTRPQFQNFTNTVMGTNSNLKKSVPLRNLNDIFGDFEMLNPHPPIQEQVVHDHPQNEDSYCSWDKGHQSNPSFMEYDERLSPVQKKCETSFGFTNSRPLLNQVTNESTILRLGSLTDPWQEDLLLLYPTDGNQHSSKSLRQKPHSNVQTLTQLSQKNYDGGSNLTESKPRLNSKVHFHEEIKNRYYNESTTNDAVKIDSAPESKNRYLINHYQSRNGQIHGNFLASDQWLPEPKKPSNHHPPKQTNKKQSQLDSAKSRKHHFRERHDSALHVGHLKFFDEKNGFGFITVREVDKSYDIFVYRNEFQRAKLDLNEIISRVRSGIRVEFRFQIAYYSGKYEESKKAINLQLV